MPDRTPLPLLSFPGLLTDRRPGRYNNVQSPFRRLKMNAAEARDLIGKRVMWDNADPERHILFGPPLRGG